jgi:alkaline phosphatase D
MNRRSLLLGALSAGALSCARGPLVRTAPPRVTHGVQSGDVATGTAVVWARCDEAARLVVEWDTTPAFAHPRRVAGPVVGPGSDHTGKVTLQGLPAAQTIFYRARFEREAARGKSEWAAGRFATPRADHVRFCWTGDTCGQGFGRNPDWGGLRGYAALRDSHPDFFLHSGDLIYADNPILPECKLADGRIWRNVSNERVARVAEALDDFRARFAYNLEDTHVATLAAEVPIIAQWDDHETHNNWWPGQTLKDSRYSVRDASLLSAHALRATFEWNPIPRGPVHRVVHYGPLLDVIVVDCRSFRTPNSRNRGDTDAMLGAAQTEWLVDALITSRARWKIIACDQPIGLIIPDEGASQEGFANGDGPPCGRERELVSVLSALKQHAVANVVFLTADVHYAAAHHYDPGRAHGVDFLPFWEFVAGPIHAGTFGPNPLDPTFGPEVRFQWAPPPGSANLAPWDGLQTFGTVDISDGALVVALYGIDGRQRFQVEIPRA